MTRHLMGTALVGLVALATVGCSGGGGGGASLYPVKGKITYKGAPVAGATVTFIPAGLGQPATGQTDASGVYNLNTGTRPGAAAGQYKVTVTKYATSGTTQLTPEDMAKMQKEGKTPEAKSEIPGKYAAPQTSGLQANVTQDAAKNVLDFELTD